MENSNIIVDLDGTMADTCHRVHFVRGPRNQRNWNAFYAGIPHDPVKTDVFHLVRALYRDGHRIIFVSGRPDNYRDTTEKWLRKNVNFSYNGPYMRKAGDYRDDATVKAEIFEKLRTLYPGHYMAVDDRDRVVKMWRELGITCFQVAEGDF